MKKHWMIITVLVFIVCTVALAQPKPRVLPSNYPKPTYTPRPALPVHPVYRLGLSPVQIVALTLLGEARGEGAVGMHAVLAVIQQRAINRKLQPHQVCLQRKQFSCWNNGRIPVPPAMLWASNEGKVAMQLASLAPPLINRKFTGFADHYHAIGVRPYWTKGKLPVARIGRHLFYKLR